MSNSTMVRDVMVQGLEAVQRAHDLRVCDLIRQIRADGRACSANDVIATLLGLRLVMVEDTNTLLTAVRKK
jgi:hypothetical protein